MQMKFLRLLSKSAFQEMNYSCTDSSKEQAGCMVDLKGDNEVVVNNLDKINLDVTEVRRHSERGEGGAEKSPSFPPPPHTHTCARHILASAHDQCTLEVLYSPFTSRVTSISENEMNIRISLCNVRRVNGMLNISLEISPKKTH